MKKYFPLVLCALILLGGCGGGWPKATLSADTLTFSRQFEGTTSAAESIRLSNSGTATLSITSIAATGDFAETNTCTATLAPGASCKISVTFMPGANTGDLAGTLSVTDNAAGSPQTVALSGTGISGTLDGECFELINEIGGCTLVQRSAIAGACPKGQPPKKLDSTVCDSTRGGGLTIYYDADRTCFYRDNGKFEHQGSCKVIP